MALGAQPDPQAEDRLLRLALSRHAPGARTLDVLQVGSGVAAEGPARWEGLGVPEVRAAHVRSRGDAEDPALLARVEGADALLLTGAHALRITNLLGGSPLLAALRRAYARGALVAATGAGAAALSATAMLRADAREDSLLVAPGLGLLPNAVIDTHFVARGRFQRALEVVARNPDHVALGLCEGAAIAHEGGTVEVLAGSVVVVDGHDLGHSSLRALPERPAAMERLVVHVLVAGYRYDLHDLRYLPAPAPRAEARGVATA